MKKNNMKLLSALLALMLVFQTLPAGVFANEIPQEDMEITAAEEISDTAAETIEIMEESAKEEIPAEEKTEQNDIINMEIKEEQADAPAEAEAEKAEAPAELKEEQTEAAAETKEEPAEAAAEVKAEPAEAMAEVKAEQTEIPAPAEEKKQEEVKTAQEPVKAEAKAAVQTYQITWLNEDGSVLAVTELEKNTKPVFEGEDPVKEADAHYTYEFSGWNPAIRNATSNRTYTAKFTKTAIKYNVTLNFINIMKPDGSLISASEHNSLGAGTSWNFTQKKLDNKVTYKNFSYNGTKYTYTGQWILEDGTVFSGTYRVNGNDLTSDVVITLSPVYEKEEPWHLNFRYIDRISTGSGSWSNTDAASGFTHTFRQPYSQPHYMFVNWEDKDTGITYTDGGKYVFPEDLKINGLTTDVNIYANWQPSATVQYYSADGSALLNETEAFEDITVNSYRLSDDGFIGWFDAPLAEGTAEEDAKAELAAVLTDDAALAAPAVTVDPVERSIRRVYARSLANYTVEHCLENLDGTYSVEETEVHEGAVAGSLAAAEIREYEGFSFSEETEGNLLSGTVAADGSLVLRVLYTRNSYTVSYEIEGEIPGNASGLPEAKEYRFGEEVAVEDSAKADGYLFSGWNMQDFQMPAEDVVIKGSFTLIPEEEPEEIPSEPEIIDEGSAEEEIIEEIVPETEPEVTETVEEIVPQAEPAAQIIETPAVPAAKPAVVTEEEPAQIETLEEIIPMTEPSVQVIEETAVPTAGIQTTKEWALINLIAMILVEFTSLVMAITFFEKKEDDGDQQNDDEQKKYSKFLGIIPAIVSLVTFIRTEDMNSLMVLTDEWTAFMIIILLIDLVLAYLSRNKDKEENNDENKEEQFA